METFAASSSAILKRLVVFLSGKINSNNAPVVEETLLAQRTEHPQGKFTLDVRDLEYISSAGLRVIMRLRKEEDSLNIVNASSEVYEVFDMTGISTILPVKKVLREMSIDGLELIGAGATAKVYRLDADTIIKVFNPGIGMSMIENENTRATKAFVSGVPTAISFDTVRVGDCYGTVFELLDAKDLLEIMTADKEHVLDWVRLFANSVRKMHEIEMDTAKFANVKQTSLDKLHALEGLICTPEEVAKLRKIYENVPDRTTFIHGDCHVGNVMIQDGEPVYIDLSGSGYGHPIFDMVSMCIICLMGGKTRKAARGRCIPATSARLSATRFGKPTSAPIWIPMTRRLFRRRRARFLPCRLRVSCSRQFPSPACLVPNRLRVLRELRSAVWMQALSLYVSSMIHFK